METEKAGVFGLMSFVKEFKGAVILGLSFLIGVLVLIIPLSDFFVLPDFLWFLQNRSLLNYLNSHAPLFFSMIPFFGLLLLLLVIWRKKK